MLPLNHKRTKSPLAPPLICVAKKLAKKIEGSPLIFLFQVESITFIEKMLQFFLDKLILFLNFNNLLV